jgi:hypothetical protein
LVIAQKLQEAAEMLTSSDVRARLSDAIQDAHRGSGTWAYYIDHTGDGESGDVIYSCDGDVFRAPYEISGGEGTAAKCVIDADRAEDVVPRTIYEPEMDEPDHYAAMESAKLYTKGGVPLVERMIPKSERDKAGSGSFAGKGKSFPILKAEDVAAAASSIGRAGSGNYSTDVIKKNIIRIAKEKGWTSELPKAWQDKTDAKESAATETTGTLKLSETTTRATDEALELIESAAGAEMEIKLIAPGRGSRAFYPAEVLKRDGPKVFAKGTQIYINHATKAEEAARPEGDWHKLAGALASDAYWKESDKHGPGLYAKAAFAPDIAPLIKAKASYSGMSIRANGDAAMESGRIVQKEGLPVLGKLTSAESVDVVTRAGAGGMILTEAARAANQKEENSMDAEEMKLLRESVARLSNRETRRDAIQEGARILRDVALPDAAKEYIIETVLKESLPMKDGALDTAKFTESVNNEAKRFGSAIGATPRVTGMGAAAPVEITEADRAAAKEAETANEQRFAEAWGGLIGNTGDKAVLERAMKGRAN